MINAIQNGTKKGISMTIKLSKVTIPIYIIIKILELTPFFLYLSKFFSPVMKIFNLPGEAALPLVLGNCLNVYAGIGAMSALNLNSNQITTLAIMISFSHTLFLETAVIKQVKVDAIKMVFLRIGTAIIFGILTGQLLGGN
ncbi:nucleoside recognition protein [Cetobacterium sp. 2A]|uniref:nucleoside recognition domain-containing protein n=1 Tax=unclassified Cetobacterium TaxID=2630983 RepID=UPI00163C13C5|nr:nucleoside recognition domain-containing protein [Cetobacterium sp. 2A]MBC2857344.1 nucleoside recognition protein [Cetobacterium sp. 2A]